MAPQVIERKYDHMCDLWSCGVIMYVLLCGYPPFNGNTDADVLKKVQRGKVFFHKAEWQHVSEDAKELIGKLLKLLPQDRYTAEQALNHAWVKNKAPKAQDAPLQSSIVDNLRAFRSQNKLKKAALHVIASQLDGDKIKELRNVFMALDENGDGELTIAELRDGLAKAGLTEIPADLEQIMKDVDTDGSGAIDYTEFLAASLDRKQYIQEDVCWSAFKVFDLNGDGKISMQELEQVLNSGSVEEALGAQTIKDLMKEVDLNGDGEIDFEEFMFMMKGSKTPRG